MSQYIPVHPNKQTYSQKCAYCQHVVTSRTEGGLRSAVKRHERKEHIEEYLYTVRCERANEARQTTKVLPVVYVAYAKASRQRNNIVIPATVEVPARWHCEAVHIKVTNDGRLIAYPPGRMGQMERGWELGEAMLAKKNHHEGHEENQIQ